MPPSQASCLAPGPDHRHCDSNRVAVYRVVCSMCLNFITRDIYHLWFDLPLQT